MPANQGTYCLILRLDRASTIPVGRLGAARFARGWYCYVGSALAHLEQRVARHLRAQKRHRWHIDYLLTRAQVRAVVLLRSPQRLECRLSRELAFFAGPPVLAGFGSSDCRCPSHLHYFQRKPLDLVHKTALDLASEVEVRRAPLA